MFGSERGMEDVVHGGLNVMIYDTIINQHEQYFFWRLSKEGNILANPKKEQSAHSTKLYAQVDNQLVEGQYGEEAPPKVTVFAWITAYERLFLQVEY